MTEKQAIARNSNLGQPKPHPLDLLAAHIATATAPPSATPTTTSLNAMPTSATGTSQPQAPSNAFDN